MKTTMKPFALAVLILSAVYAIYAGTTDYNSVVADSVLTSSANIPAGSQGPKVGAYGTCLAPHAGTRIGSDFLAMGNPCVYTLGSQVDVYQHHGSNNYIQVVGGTFAGTGGAGTQIEQADSWSDCDNNSGFDDYYVSTCP